jgi:hypothetical protein
MINVSADTTRLTPNVSETDPPTLQDIRRALLERGGLLDAGRRPELDRWTAVRAARRYSADSSHQ